jgi:hypothetical protein
MTLTNPKTLRADLVAKLKTIALLGTDLDGTVHVVGFFPKDPGGISPFCGIDRAGWQPNLTGDRSSQTPNQFVVGFWVRRDDPAAAEDTLDDLALALAGLLEAVYYQPKFFNPSQSDYEEIDGIQYKFELHFVEIDS